jgi:sortase A
VLLSGLVGPVSPPDPVPARARRRRSWGWLVVLGLAVVLVGGGYGTYAITNFAATSAYAEQIAAGSAVGTLTIPRFGDDFAVPVLAGTSLATLRQGVGWYEGTAGPGEPGNFAVAGHRLGWGQPFAKLGSLEVGDQVVVTASGKTFTYAIITGPTVVRGTATDVLAAVPGGPGRAPTKALITLTTAATVLPSPDRLIVVGELV